ncbi:MAG TPA: tRNA guanosine(34) transglycosylase Tgt [Firmicutes bacterium]|nr:tRNA guanosine(34) transglycosylase Tgt [Bacillota bacterium]
MADGFSLEITHKDAGCEARTGVLHTNHGDCALPMFMPVGTLATVKHLSPAEVKSLGAGVILANSYHLSLRPTAEVVAEAGGVQKFMRYEGPMLTDSGGFQVWSLAKNKGITEKGIQFRSHLDGRLLEFTPESVMDIEQKIGADIAMCFDECAPYPVTHEYMENSVARTIRWAERCLKAHTRPDQALFAIVQGGDFQDIREACARALAALPFDGYAIGGTSIGEPREVEYRMVSYAVKNMPWNKPRYLMGVGSIDMILDGISKGVDMFDCVLPTRLGRHGALMTSTGRLNIKGAAYAEDFTPIEEGCDCPACRGGFTRAYIHHLVKCDEGFGLRLCSMHNIRFLIRVVEGARKAIQEDRFLQYREETMRKFGDERGF